MANEITYSISLNCENGNYISRFTKNNQSVTQAAQGAAEGIQSIGTSSELLDFGDITTAGYCVLQNLDATNFVTYGYNDAGTLRAVGKLLAGEIALFRLSATSLRLVADTGACKLYFKVFEN